MKSAAVLCLAALALGLSAAAGGISRRSVTEANTTAEDREESVRREVERQLQLQRQRRLRLELLQHENNPTVAWEGGQVTLRCSPRVEGPVTWSIGLGGGVRRHILTAAPNAVVKHVADPGGRVDAGADRSLRIRPAVVGDSGMYFCNGWPAAKLVVNRKRQAIGNDAAPRPVKTLVTAIVGSICSLIAVVAGIAVYCRRR